MKGWERLGFTLMFLLLVISAHAQGTFQNLGFESGTLVPIPGDPNDRFYFSDAFPGWTGYAGTTPITGILYDNETVTSANISLVGKNGPFIGNVIAGQYTALLQAGGSFGSFVDTSIAQVGLVPADAQMLLVKAAGVNLSASFAGQGIPLVPIGSGANYTLFAGDISGFSGQIGELRLSSLSTPGSPVNSVFVDSLAFTAVPEPRILCVEVLGGFLLGIWICRTRKKSASYAKI